MRYIFIFLLFSFIAACNDESETTTLSALNPKAVEDGNTVDFGDVLIGTSASKSLKIKNEGRKEFRIENVKIDKITEEFKVINLRELNETAAVAPGKTLEVKLSYTPVDINTDQILITLDTDITDSPILILKGIARGKAPVCEAENTFWDGNPTGNCVCLEGYVLDKGICKNPCEVENSCSNANRSICSFENNKKKCSCDDAFHLVGDECFSDNNVLSCGKSGIDCSKENIPENAVPDCSDAKCSWKCLPDYQPNDKAKPEFCIKKKDPKNCGPEKISCNDNIACTLDTCIEENGNYSCKNEIIDNFCLINGNCIAEGKEDNNNPCLECRSNLSKTSFSPNNNNIPQNDNFCKIEARCENGQAKFDSRSCDDKISCTSDLCNERLSRCENTIKKGSCLISGTCYNDAETNPKNPCEECISATFNQGFSADDSNSFDDGLFCTINDKCLNGLPFTETRTCDDGLFCTDDQCNESSKLCENSVKSSYCLIDGKCINDGSLDPKDQCKSCLSLSAKDKYQISPGLDCDDNDFCSETSSCDSAGNCIAKDALDCGAGNYCDSQSSSCNPLNCSPSSKFCDGDILKTCDNLGSGSIGEGKACNLGCGNQKNPAECVTDLAITDLKASLNGNDISLSWSLQAAQTSNQKYRILKSEKADILSANEIAEVNNNSYTDSNQKPGSYFYWIKINESGVDLSASNMASVKVLNESINFDFVSVSVAKPIIGTKESAKGRSPDEFLHQVSLSDFQIMSEEVSQIQWRSILGNNPVTFTKCGDKCPVENISFYDALAFANAKSRIDGYNECYDLKNCSGEPGINFSCQSEPVFAGLKCDGYRLPTEAEWEVAYRAGSSNDFYNGPITSLTGSDQNLNKIAWYNENSALTPNNIAQKQANALGIYDMAGNVKEWVWDFYDSYPFDNCYQSNFNSKDFAFCKIYKSWNDARSYCDKYDTDLATIESSNENNHISSVLSIDMSMGNEAFWIGLNDIMNEANFSWVDGSKSSYRKWVNGEPNDAGNGEDCVETRKYGYWNDNSCTSLNTYFICKGSYNTNPTGPKTGQSRVIRGGSYKSTPQQCRASHREAEKAGSRSSEIGFRLARTK